MARQRPDDDEDDRPRRRRDEDDDEDDRPRRRRDDEDYDDDDYDDRPRRRRRGPMGPLDSTFRDTNIVVLVLFSLCCGIIALILSLVGFLTAKDPTAKSHALLVLIISGVLSVVVTGLQFANVIRLW